MESSNDSLGIYTKLIHPLYVQGRTEAEIAKELGVDEAYIHEVIKESSQTRGDAVFHVVVRELERLVEFTHPWHSRLCALYILQTYLAELLPGVFYLAFVGAKSSGKTTCVQILTELSKAGIMLTNFSVPYVARKRSTLCSIGIDEYDSVVGEKKEYADQLLRAGYKPGAIYGRWDYQAKKAEELPIYGPVCLSFRENLEDALMSRIVSITMARVKDDDMVDRVIDNMIRDEKGLKAEVESFCDSVERQVTANGVRELADTEAFRERMKHLAKPGVLPRDVELGSIMTLISEICGIDIDTEMASAFAAQADFQDPESGGLGETVRDFWEERGRPDFLHLETIRDLWNVKRKSKGDKQVSQYAFTKHLRDLGLREGKELKKIHGGARVLRFDGESKAIELLAESPSPSALSTSQTSLTGDKVPLQAGEGVGEMVRELRDILRKSGEGLGSFTWDSLWSVALPLHVPEETAKKWIEKALQSGEIYESKMGVYKFA